MCATEAIAYIAGEPHSDHPACLSYILGAFMRSWNDGLPSDAERDQLLKPLLPLLVGTATTPADEARRGWMATDWLVREYTPTWLDLSGLNEDAASLRALPEITSAETARAAQPTIESARLRPAAAIAAARDAAWAAASVAAWDAAWAAAGDVAIAAASVAASVAAWDAAGDVAIAAARDAASDAARDAASDAARDAARDAASAAAWDAARDAASAAAWDAAIAAAWAAAARAAAWDAASAALAPTVARVQEGAQELVRRMAAVGREVAA